MEPLPLKQLCKSKDTTLKRVPWTWNLKPNETEKECNYVLEEADDKIDGAAFILPFAFIIESEFCPDRADGLAVFEIAPVHFTSLQETSARAIGTFTRGIGIAIVGTEHFGFNAQ